MPRCSTDETASRIGSTHQKALVNSPHFSLPGVPGSWVGGGRSRLPIRLPVARPSFRCSGAGIRTIHPSGSRWREAGTASLHPWPFLRAPRKSSVPDRRPSGQGHPMWLPWCRGPAPEWLGIWAHPVAQRQARAGSIHPSWLRPEPIQAPCPGLFQISRTPVQLGKASGHAERRKRPWPSCWRLP